MELGRSSDQTQQGNFTLLITIFNRHTIDYQKLLSKLKCSWVPNKGFETPQNGCERWKVFAEESQRFSSSMKKLLYEKQLNLRSPGRNKKTHSNSLADSKTVDVENMKGGPFEPEGTRRPVKRSSKLYCTYKVTASPLSGKYQSKSRDYNSKSLPF